MAFIESVYRLGCLRSQVLFQIWPSIKNSIFQIQTVRQPFAPSARSQPTAEHSSLFFFFLQRSFIL